MREIRIGKEESGQRLDKFLRRFLPGAGTGFLYKMLRKKNIVLDDRKASGREILREGDAVRIYFSEETIRNFQRAEDKSVSEGMILPEEAVLYADSNILIINKPAGMLTQKAEKNDVSLTELARAWLLKKGLRTEEDRLLYEPGPANRLDRNTSGLVAVPLTLPAAQKISEMFRDRTVHKQYLALVAGKYSGPEDRTAWCMRDPETRITKVFFQRISGADRIETRCEPLAVSEDRTLLKVTLITGKTHQIRSHLQACGYPVIGDPKYGRYLPDSIEKSKRDTCGPGTQTALHRQFLHAWRLEFPACPGLFGPDGRIFTAPLPEDLEKELYACGFRIPDNLV